MRWQVKPNPNLLDLRVIEKFALLPFKFPNGTIIWLEKYKIKQRYTHDIHYKLCWVDIEYFKNEE